MTIVMLYHPVGLWLSRLDQAMLDAIGLTFLIERISTAGFALTGACESIGEGVAVFGQHGLDLEGAFSSTRVVNARASLADWLLLNSRYTLATQAMPTVVLEANNGSTRATSSTPNGEEL